MAEIARVSDRLGHRLAAGRPDHRAGPGRTERSLRPHQARRHRGGLRRVRRRPRPGQADHGLRHRQDLHRTENRRTARHRERAAAARMLFLVPSISLLSPDAAGVDRPRRELDLRAFAVCSDTKVGRRDPPRTSTSTTWPIPVTTDPDQARRRDGAPQARQGTDGGVHHLPVAAGGRRGPEARR